MSSHLRSPAKVLAAWFLERAYNSYADMAATEAADKKRDDFVIIATRMICITR